LPDFGPGGFGLFDVTIGGDIHIAGGDELNNHDNTGNGAGEFENIAKKEEKSLTLGTGIEVGVVDWGSDLSKYACHLKITV